MHELARRILKRHGSFSPVRLKKRQKLGGSNAAAEQSDSDCIIVDVEHEESITADVKPTNTDNDLVDDIVFVCQTGGQDALKDLPHSRPDCAAHAFSQQLSTANGNFCCQCFCFVSDVKASDCKFWGGNRQRDHCHAHTSAYWNALRKAARRGNTAILQQEHSSLEPQLTTHWLDSGKKKGKRSSVQSRPQTLEQFWARAGYTRTPRGSTAAAVSRRSNDSSSPVVVLDNAAAAAAAQALQPPAAAVQGEEPILPAVRIKQEKIAPPESPPPPKRHLAVVGLCSLDLQQEQRQAYALQQSPRQQRQGQQQHVTLGDITNTRGTASPAALAALAAAGMPAEAAADTQNAAAHRLAPPVTGAAAVEARSYAHRKAATAALQTALGAPSGTPAVEPTAAAAAAAAGLTGPQCKAAAAALHAAAANTAAAAGAHSKAAAAALKAAADGALAAAAAASCGLITGAHRTAAEAALQIALKVSAAAGSVIGAVVASTADTAVHIGKVPAAETATAGAASRCAPAATDTPAAAQMHMAALQATVGIKAAAAAAESAVAGVAAESAAGVAAVQGAKHMAAARIAEQQAEDGAVDGDVAAAAAAVHEQPPPMSRTAKGRKSRTTWQCNGFRGKTPKCGSCGNCLNPQRKQACSVNRERIAQGLPPIVKGAAVHS